ncbi:MAG: ABC transporter ATP-binding protein [Kineosporiaceae bacterium]
MSTPVVEIEGLRKSYRSRTVLHDVSFHAPEAALTALLGPNGAGKTTTVEICEGLRRADGGRVRVLGRDPGERADRAALRRDVGVMLQDGGLPLAAPAGAFLRHVAGLHEHPRDIGELADVLGLGSALRTPVRRLSGGQRARLGFAVAVVGRPRLAFLDEPTSGLDPQARRAVWEFVRRLREEGTSLVLTTHALDEVEDLADRVVILDEGRVLVDADPAELVDGGESVDFSGPPALVLSDLVAALPEGLDVAESAPGRYSVRSRPGAPEVALDAQVVATVTTWCAARGIRLAAMSFGRRTLEDVYLDLTGRSLR